MPLTNDPDEAALLATIFANPDDDAPRLIIADWYDEHDHEARAAFIRESLWNRASFEVPDDELTTWGTRSEWYGVWSYLHTRQPLSDLRVEWHRGFIYRVTCTTRTWREDAAAALLDHPIVEVTLTTIPQNATEDELTEWLRQWPTVMFHVPWPTDDDDEEDDFGDDVEYCETCGIILDAGDYGICEECDAEMGDDSWE